MTEEYCLARDKKPTVKKIIFNRRNFIAGRPMREDELHPSSKANHLEEKKFDAVDYFRDLYFKEHEARIKELQAAQEHEEKCLREVSESSREDGRNSFLVSLVELMAFASVIPILSKFTGCSWSTFFKELFFLPPSLVTLTILIEFVGLKFRKSHRRKEIH